MAEIEICPQCGGPVVSDGSSQMCTECGLMYSEMEDLDDVDDFDDNEESDNY